MPKSATRWIDAAHDAINSAVQESLSPYVADGLTVVPGETIYGPDQGIPDGQYECRREWATTELAQNWVDIIDSIAEPFGFAAVFKTVIPD